MRVEIHRHRQILLQGRDDRSRTKRIDQTSHILQCDNFGTYRLHLLGFVHKIFVGKDFLRFLSEQFCKKSFRLFGLRVDSIANRTVGYASKLIEFLYGETHIVYIIQCVKYAHHIQAILYSFFIETLQNRIGIRHIAEQITSSGQCCEQRFAVHDLADGAQTIPRRFVKISHHRVRHGTAPHFNCIKTCFFIIREQTVNISLRHAGSEQRLLAVTHCQVAYF